MDVSSTVARKCQAMGEELDRANIAATRKGAQVAKDTVLTQMRSVVPSGVLKHAGKAGAKLNVRYDVKGTTNATALVKAVGPWQLVEGDTKAHFIVAKGYGGSRKSRQARADNASRTRGAEGSSRGWLGPLKGKPRAVSFGGVARAYVWHPGTKGRRPWFIGIRKSLLEINGIVKTNATDAVLRGFRR